MNSLFLLLRIITLLVSLMKISPRKDELSTKYGSIVSKHFNGYDNLWILNTSCHQCLLEFSCHSLTLSHFNSIIFTSSFDFISSDATLRNYSSCPNGFVARTDSKGYYFVYYYFLHFKSRDYFNVSYVVRPRNKSFDHRCIASSESKLCPVVNETRALSTNNSISRIYSDDSSLFENRFLHASAQVGDTLYVHGGLSSRHITEKLFIKFSDKKWQTVTVTTVNQPPCLYSHSMSYHKTNNTLVIFGGSTCTSRLLLSRIIWIFSIDTASWRSLNFSTIVRPVMGHSSHIYREILYSFFGLTQSPRNDYYLLSSIQRFNLTSEEWMDGISSSNGIALTGLVYHCSYQDSDRVWIFGGLYQPELTTLSLSNRLSIFDVSELKWIISPNNGPSLYFHSCIFINGTLISVGGLNIEHDGRDNDFLTRLESYLYIYNPLTTVWVTMSMNFTNIGHGITKSRNNSLLIIGGKSSVFHDSLTYIFYETCTKSDYRNFTECELIMPKSLVHESVWSIVTKDDCNYPQCDTCVHEHCIWCSLQNQCMTELQLAIRYPVGGCEVPIRYESKCPVKCEYLTNSGCVNCTRLSFCGWCEFRSNPNDSQHLSGFGKCIDGSIKGPSQLLTDSLVNKYCPLRNPSANWYFLPSQCLSCNCNGHAVCTSRHSYQFKKSKKLSIVTDICSECQHNTTGSNCQDCKEGYQSSGLNGQKCMACKCVSEKYAGSCNTNGICEEFCIEKGRLGRFCESCDIQNNFTFFHNMCVFKAKINFQYVLDKKTDSFNKFTDRVNFLLTDLISNMDLNFKIRCSYSLNAIIRVELFNESGHRAVLLRDKYCHGFETLFPKHLFKGLQTYQLLFTVSGFQNASYDLFQLEMMFTQKTYINLPYIFISFFACLSASVLSFYAVYKLRQHFNRRNWHYRTLLVMERPFAKIELSTNNNEPIDAINSAMNPSVTAPPESSLGGLITTKLDRKETIPIISVEPYRINEGHSQSISDDNRLSSNNIVIVSLLFSSPKCAVSSSSNPRIFIGSTVTKATKHDRKLMLELPTKTSTGNSIMVDRDFDTSVSPSAAEELLTTEV